MRVPEDYFLNRIDAVSCIEAVYTAEDFADARAVAEENNTISGLPADT